MTDLYVYTPAHDADLLLVQLWSRMQADGDLDKIFSDPQFALSTFLRALAPPNEAIYAFDDQGITLLVWLERFAAGVFLSAYFRPDKRQQRATHECFRRVLKSAVDAYGTIINMTWQEKLGPIHLAMGYTFVGRVPMLLRGRDAFVWSCNRVSFDLAEEAALATTTAPVNGQEASWRAMAQEEDRNGRCA